MHASLWTTGVWVDESGVDLDNARSFGGALDSLAPDGAADALVS
jgi:hypothetical protein